VSDYRQLVHEESGRVLVEQARWCHTFASKLRGFTWRRRLPPGAGLVLVENSDSRLSTAIHMLFVFFDLGVIWVNSEGEIVDLQVARAWRPSYVPQAPARYVIETHPAVLNYVRIGDHVRFETLL
jgi:uncharacterized membrane protein (UPF0127 family)